MKAETKEKLELVHLVGYIPYGLNLLISDYTDDRRGELCILIGIVDLKNKIELRTDWGTFWDFQIKPALRPLSNLIDDILNDENDSNYRLHLELSEILQNPDCTYFVKSLINNDYYAVDVRLWSDIEEFMYKNHFDWKYNLIEKGLAISYNDLNTIENGR